MSNYVLELGLEEIPARFMPGFLKSLRSSVEALLKTHRLDYDSVETQGSYRRLILSITGLAKTQADLDEWVKGPPSKIAFDDAGAPLPPAVGFAKKMSVTPADLEEREGACYARRFEKGQPAESVLPTLITVCIQQWSLPIAMRWGSETTPFFRPLHWMVSLLDTTVVPLTLFGITAGDVSYGHRMLTDHPESDHLIAGQPIQVESATSLISQLREHFVEPVPEKRESIIVETVGKACVDPGLLEELVYLVEWPTVLSGTFESSYLEIPQAALIDCMQKHQKYIPQRDASGQLLPEFWIVGESVTPENQAQIQKGNERVLKARLEDVKFFWDEDTSQSMDSFLPKLESVVFQKNLGTVADKTVRIATIANRLNEQLSLGLETAVIDRAAKLAKADLVSKMVYELPALQGVMGRLYLERQGESADVAATAEEHYLPKFVGDKLPESSLATVVSIADKIDTVVACFVNKLNPTGSQDPWGVRRAVLGILQMMKQKQLDLDVQQLVALAYETLDKATDSQAECLRFIAQRFESDIVSDGVAKDTVKALSETILTDFHASVAWAKVIDDARADQQFKPLVETAVRVNRLAKKQEDRTLSVTQTAFKDPIENQAFETLQAAENAFSTLNTPSLSPMMGMVPFLTSYFDAILVMDEDPAVKANRLAFIVQCDAFFSQILDWERLTIS